MTGEEDVHSQESPSNEKPVEPRPKPELPDRPVISTRDLRPIKEEG